MKNETNKEYKKYIMDNGIQIEIPKEDNKTINIEQRESYQGFINVLSNIITKYRADEE